MKHALSTKVVSVVKQLSEKFLVLLAAGEAV